MNCIDLLIDFITRCMNFIERYSNALVGIGTIITSIITIRVYKKQNRIYKEQTALQRNQNQPYFVVYTRVSKDKENDDTIHGNETLYVENVGQKFLDINIEDRVFFTLT